jgi:threonine/homoserine efflux transporter RhtA
MISLHSLPIEPIVALLAGILILLQPRLLNYVVAIYLIVVGVLGLSHNFAF